MKHLKEKLIATIAMLLVATVMLTSASFAWFTISTNPEISNINTTVTTNENLEIALDKGTGAAPNASAVGDAGHNTTWGNLVDLNKYFAQTGGLVLKPVSAVFDENGVPTFKVPQFGLDGRIDNETNLTKVSAGTVGEGDFSDLNGVYAIVEKVEDTAIDKAYAFEVDYWVRTNQSGKTLTLSEAVFRDDSSNHEKGLGSYITNDNVTVKLVDNETKTVYDLVPGDLADGKFPLTLKQGDTAATIALTANTAKLLKMYVYLDGAGETNETLTGSSSFAMNVQFKINEGDITSMNYPEANHGRT